MQIYLSTNKREMIWKNVFATHIGTSKFRNYPIVIQNDVQNSLSVDCDRPAYSLIRPYWMLESIKKLEKFKNNTGDDSKKRMKNASILACNISSSSLAAWSKRSICIAKRDNNERESRSKKAIWLSDLINYWFVYKYNNMLICDE